MTQEEIIAGNIIIAEFMGYTGLSDEFKIPEHERMIAFNSIKNQEFFWSDRFKHTELCFHTSWDWLMPVLKKISGEFNSNDYDYDENEYSKSLEDALYPDYAIWEFLEGDILSIYSRALDLIKLINKQAVIETYKEWEESVFERFEANPGLFNYEPTGSPDVEHELQFQVREEGEQVEFFQIGYSEEEGNFYFNHNQFDGNVVYRTSQDPADLHRWMEEINEYEPS